MSCSALLAGAAALAAAAVAVPAIAENLTDHEMTLRLPGGGTETIHYTGRIAPEVRFDSNPFLSHGQSAFFAAWDNLSSDMARQMAAILRQTDMLMPGPADLDSAGLTTLSSGTSSYSAASRAFGGNLCTHMTQIIIPGHGGKPRVLTRTSGQCGDGGSVADDTSGRGVPRRTL